MNIYARYFDHDILAHNSDELVNFLSSISDIHVTKEMIDDIQEYAQSEIPYPKRYKIRPRVYFILIKTDASTIEEFKSHKNSSNRENHDNNPSNKKDQQASALMKEAPGWYKGTINFKRVVQIPETGKFQYQDTTFSALVKAVSGQECYNQIIDHLKRRQDVDKRSQFPSAKGNNFTFERIANF